MNFFKDKNGKVVLWQFPNWPLIGWAGCRILALYAENHQLRTWLENAGTLFLIVWAILEIVSGDSPFRRVLGTIILVVITYSVFF